MLSSNSSKIEPNATRKAKNLAEKLGVDLSLLDTKEIIREIDVKKF